jgi:hypothetical protein
MDDLDARIPKLSFLDRVPLIEASISLDAQFQAQARGGRRAKYGSRARDRADAARTDSDQLGRIIYFLRFRSPALGATERHM